MRTGTLTPQPAAPARSAWRRDARVWSGLALLLIGLGLIDMSFTVWRNDQRNFPHANGAYPTSDGTHGWHRHLERPRLLKAMAYSGLGILVLSVVLLGKSDEPQDGVGVGHGDS